MKDVDIKEAAKFGQPVNPPRTFPDVLVIADAQGNGAHVVLISEASLLLHVPPQGIETFFAHCDARRLYVRVM